MIIIMPVTYVTQLKKKNNGKETLIFFQIV